MEKNQKLGDRGITLIALIVTIIVLLILAGVSIAVLTGQNGILNRASEAKTTSEIAKVEEVANLELTSSMIGVRAGEQGATEKTVAQIAKYLKDEGYIEDYDQTGLRTIIGMSFGDLETNGVTLEIGETLSEIEAGFSTSNPSEDYYVQISGKKYPISKANGRISISKTEITTGTQPTGEITSVNAIPTGIVNAEKVSEKIDQIKITGVAKGTATVTAKYTDDIYATIPVTVKGNVSVTTRSANTSVGTVTPTMTGTSKAEGSSISLTATVTDNDYQFDGWYESIDNGTATQKSTSLSYTYTVPENATSVVVEARFSEKPSTIELGTSFVGYYADLNNDGSITRDDDGMIFVDLGSNPKNTSGLGQDYSYTKITNANSVKNYVSGTTTYNNNTVNYLKLDTASVENTNLADRFYVLGLKDITDEDNNTTLYWYKAAYGNMENPPTQTSTTFGTGKTNTSTMITKWTNGDYNGSGTQSNRDMWKAVKAKRDAVASSSASNKPEWFVPSKEEWAAVKGELVGSSSYSSLGLSNNYWSSSQRNSLSAWYADFGNDNISYNLVNSHYYVRLATTF